MDRILICLDSVFSEGIVWFERVCRKEKGEGVANNGLFGYLYILKAISRFQNNDQGTEGQS